MANLVELFSQGFHLRIFRVFRQRAAGGRGVPCAAGKRFVWFWPILGATSFRARPGKRLTQLTSDDLANHLPRAVGEAEELVLSWADHGRLARAAGEALPATVTSLI